MSTMTTTPDTAALDRTLNDMVLSGKALEAFEQFYAEVGLKPTPAHQLDRIDNDKGYEPGNVRWVTKSQNERNRRCDNCLILKARIKELENQLQISTNSEVDRTPRS